MEDCVVTLVRGYEEMHISTLSLAQYFPDKFKIYEFSADNETVSGEVTVDDISNWLRAKENYSFVFQCLLCCQEMTFRTVFKTGNYDFNRSHLLTAKHTNNVCNSLCVGLLFTTSKKFVMCKWEAYQSGKVFESMKKVKRREIALINENILDQIFCNQYNMYNFDRGSNELVKFEYEGDIVRFMRCEVRPLFCLYCLFCDMKAHTYTLVVQHLCSKKHRKKMGSSKGNIVAVKDYNIFIACNFEKLSCFLHVSHVNSYLEEIVIGGEGTVVITSSYSKDGKSKPYDGPVSVDAKPVKLPNGMKKNESVRINTRFSDLDAIESPEESNKSLTTLTSKVQRNVTIYEFSSNSFKEHYADNLIFSVFSGIGCGVWCTRCSLPIFSSNALQAHLLSEKHKSRIRNNDQIGFMCHSCNIFFLALKGEYIAHTHSSKEVKDIKKLFGSYDRHLSYKDASLNSAINSAYSHLIQNISEPVRFCCLACFDMTKCRLTDLSSHEGIMGRHEEDTNDYVFSLCSFCNVIYIANKDKENSNCFFKEHFATHLNCNDTVTYKVSWKKPNFEIDTKELTVDKSMFSSEGKSNIATIKNLEVRASTFFSQLVHPGVSDNEFDNIQEWTKIQLVNYISFITGQGVVFSCLPCQFVNKDEDKFYEHLFANCHEKNKPFYVKFCDVCKEMLFSSTMSELQRHFNSIDLGHNNKLLYFTGLPQNTKPSWDSYNSTIIGCKNVFVSRSALCETIIKDVSTMKDVWSKKNHTFKMLTNSIEVALSEQFTNMNIEFHGSHVSGLAMPDSDIDVSINVGNDNFNKVETSLASEATTFKVLRSIPDCSVPIIRVLHLKTGMVGDISLTSRLEEKYCSMLIKIYIDFDERVHLLLAAIRHWAILVKLRDSRAVTGHALNWLVLFYLMQPDVRLIPPVSYVIKIYGGLENILHYEKQLSWEERKFDLSKNKTYLELIEGFFHYYSLMNFSNYKLCPHNGLIVPNKTGEPMYLEDPISRDNTFGKRAMADLSQTFRSLCSLTLNMSWRIN